MESTLSRVLSMFIYTDPHFGLIRELNLGNTILMYFCSSFGVYVKSVQDTKHMGEFTDIDSDKKHKNTF